MPFWQIFFSNAWGQNRARDVFLGGGGSERGSNTFVPFFKWKIVLITGCTIFDETCFCEIIKKKCGGGGDLNFFFII
jgi:hypothetical protein